MPVLTEVPPRSPRPTHALRHIATQGLQLGSPTPKFEIERPRRRSISPVPASPSATASLSKLPYAPPALTWRSAAQDAMAGIYYTKDAFPSSSFLPPPFSREPVTVEAGERVELLEEFDEYAVRVRVLRTDVVGLIPAWNMEGALERLTKMNTAFNEAATCPVEARALRRRDSESSSGTIWDDAASPSTDGSITHVHSRCVPFSTRVRFPDFYGVASAYSDDSDSDSDSSPQSPPEFERGRPLQQSQPAVFEVQPETLEKGGISETGARSRSGGRKSVNFAAGERPQVVFRYLSEDLVELFFGEKSEAGDPESESSEGDDDEEWWWQGWEEACEDSAGEDEGAASGSAVEAVTKEGPTTIDLDELFPFAFDEKVF